MLADKLRRAMGGAQEQPTAPLAPDGAMTLGEHAGDPDQHAAQLRLRSLDGIVRDAPDCPAASTVHAGQIEVGSRRGSRRRQVQRLASAPFCFLKPVDRAKPSATLRHRKKVAR